MAHGRTIPGVVAGRVGAGGVSGARYPSQVLDHVTLWVPDLERARESWAWLLAELGYSVDPSLPTVALFRHPSGFAVALEQSTDMVGGMLYSRFRPGVNHMAFTVASPPAMAAIAEGAAGHGWSALPRDAHPIAGGADVVYLEDRDGFEVELVARVDRPA